MRDGQLLSALQTFAAPLATTSCGYLFDAWHRTFCQLTLTPRDRNSEDSDRNTTPTEPKRTFSTSPSGPAGVVLVFLMPPPTPYGALSPRPPAVRMSATALTATQVRFLTPQRPARRHMESLAVVSMVASIRSRQSTASDRERRTR